MVFNGNLIPWNWGKKNLPVKKESNSPGKYSPYFSLQQDMNRVFENFFRTFEAPMMTTFSELAQGMFQPRVEVKESSSDVRVSVELPGIDDRDLDVSISENYLTIKGEKHEEKQDNISGYYRMERTYGSFHRSIPFPCEIDKDKAEATFKRGVLTVILPKTSTSQQQIKKIAIKKE